MFQSLLTYLTLFGVLTTLLKATPVCKDTCEVLLDHHWDEVTNKCVSSLPCALETTSEQCEANTWECEWLSGSCSKRVRAIHGSACASKTRAACEAEKTCMWSANKGCEIRPTIVISLADDLGWYDVGWKNPRARTPVLDTLRGHGVEFDRHYASRFCAPSRGMLLAGILPWRNGLQTDLNLNPVNALRCATSKDQSLIPQVLKESGGYSTHGFGKWHLGNYGDDVIPTARGFDTYHGYYGGGIVNHTPPNQFQSRRCSCRSPKKKQNQPGRCSPFGRASKLLCVTAMNMIKAEAGGKEEVIRSEDVTDVTTDLYLARRAEDQLLTLDPDVPAFLYLSFSTPHNPIFATEQFKRTVSQSRPPFGQDAPLNRNRHRDCSSASRLEYLAMVTMLDEAHRIVIDALEQTGRFENSIFLFTSDNGGQLPIRDEKRRVIKCNMGFNYPLRGGKFSFWEGGIRVVSFVASKRWIPTPLQGTVSAALVSLVDWRKTLVSASGGDPRAISQDDGIDLWGMLTGGSSEERTDLALQVWLERRRFVFLFKHMGALWKIIWGDPSSGRGAGDSGRAVPRYSRGEIDQPLELPRSEAEYPFHSGFFRNAHCRLGCLFNLDEDPAELNDLSSARKDVFAVAQTFRALYTAQGSFVRSTNMCEPRFFSTPSQSVTDRSSMDRAQKCNGFVSWLDSNGQLKDEC